ncbi:hypothetical protein NSK_003408 [Nannochloropsis salina CCMP1776]|uniref:Uncharacterized protein n=1 Tax=Nannochloropsis salina CCMP1776 TaxID=1027361 RepID=A0A4D9D4N4_9STRA|nr:hypothetical protein NSK_003408 [Nannochloropsis salina CCMP1776]|eukprot:TFJ84983.1 hypothetical protein NSK_003408 [Nannochloropsis salina CCMP1776]
MSGGGPVLKTSTLRAWKVATGVICLVTGFQLVFLTDYGDKEHVFTPIQRWYMGQLDTLLGVESEVARRLRTPTFSLNFSKEAEESARAATAAPDVTLSHSPSMPAKAGEGNREGRESGGWRRWISWW